MCSGQHSVFVLLAKMGGWELETYWQDDHPAQAAVKEAMAAAFAVPVDRLRTGIDGCGILTYAFPLREVARAFAILADPEALPPSDPRVAIAPYLTEIRDAMIAFPELVAGTRDRLDTSLMKAAGRGVVAKGGAEGLRGMGILRGARGPESPASGVALKIEDGAGRDRGTWAASVEAMRQVGAVEGQALRVLARYHRPVAPDPHGRPAAEAVPEFELAPVGELVG
jgi:L-asparaginase II